MGRRRILETRGDLNNVIKTEENQTFSKQNDDAVILSFVITSYTTKRLSDINKLLSSIKGQSCQNTEIVFVADQSKELATEVGDYMNELRITRFIVLLNIGQIGVNICRNIGIQHANGRIIAIIDDDIVLFPDWVEQVLKSYSENDVIGTTGPAYPLWKTRRKCHGFQRNFTLFGDVLCGIGKIAERLEMLVA